LPVAVKRPDVAGGVASPRWARAIRSGTDCRVWSARRSFWIGPPADRTVRWRAREAWTPALSSKPNGRQGALDDHRRDETERSRDDLW